MIVLPLQYDTHRGPDAIGQHKLVFTMDESITSDFNPLSIKKGTQFLVMLVEADSKEMTDFATETKEETMQRFKRHLEALIADVANTLNVDKTSFREEFKKELIKTGIIKKSTTELTLEQIAQQIIKLKQIKYENSKLDKESN